MKKLKYIFYFSPFVLLYIYSCKKNEYKNIDCNSIQAKYSSDIFPIINSKCNSSGCHGAGSSKGDFTNYQGLKIKADNGSLEKSTLLNKDMPPAGPLSKEERNKIKCWLNNGAQNN